LGDSDPRSFAVIGGSQLIHPKAHLQDIPPTFREAGLIKMWPICSTEFGGCSRNFPTGLDLAAIDTA